MVEGVIMVALLLTTPLAWLWGEATVVFARILVGQISKPIAQM